MHPQVGKFHKRVERCREKAFPMKLGKGYSCHLVGRKEFNDFLRKNFNKVFPSAPNRGLYGLDGLQERRRRSRELLYHDHQQAHHDHLFFFNAQHEPIGWTCGESEDGVTYYMRNTGIMPQHQGRGIYANFLPQFLGYIESLGFERVSSHHDGNNGRILVPKIKNGFGITGMENHESWGALIKMVKHLKADRKKAYVKKFN